MQFNNYFLLIFCLIFGGCAITKNPQVFRTIENGAQQIELINNNQYKISYKGRKNQSQNSIDNEIENIINSFGKSKKYQWYVINDTQIAKQNFRDLGLVDGGITLFKLWANYQISPQNSSYGYKYYQFPIKNTPLNEIEYEIIAKTIIISFGIGERPYNGIIIE